MMIETRFPPLSGILMMCLTLAASMTTGRTEPRVVPTDVVNIAAAANGGRVLAATSTLNDDPAYKASNLIDGSVYDAAHSKGTNGWASNKFDPIAMDAVTIGFKDNAVRRIGKVVLNPASNVTQERWAKDVEVQVSTDTAEGPYRAVAQLTVRQAPERQEFTVLPTQARFVRLMFRSNWGSDRAVALGEVEIYEAIDTSDTVGQVIAQLEGTITDLRRFRQTQVDSINAGSDSLVAGAALPRPAVTAPAATDRAGRNIAAAKNGGRIVDFSSTFISDPQQGPDPDYKPENLIDGENYLEPTDKTPEKGTYGWSSQGFQKGHEFVTLGFKDDRTRLINKIILNPTSNQARMRWARKVDLQITSGSAKEGPYRTVISFTLRNEPTNQDFVLPRPLEAKYVRFVFTANGPGGNSLPNADPDVDSDRAVSLGEIEIYEATASGQELDVLIGRFVKVLDDLKQLRNQGALHGSGAMTAAAGTAEAISAASRPKAGKRHPANAAPQAQNASKKQPAKRAPRPQEAKDKPLARHSSKYFVAIVPFL